MRDLNVRIGKFSAFERMILPKTWYAVRMRFMIEQDLSEKYDWWRDGRSVMDLQTDRMDERSVYRREGETDVS